MNMSSDLRTISKKFEASNNVYSFYELAVTIIGYAFFVYVVYLSFVGHFWPAYVVFSLISSLFMVKLFTLLHDCAHESMFSSAFLNVWVGRFISIFMTMPFTSWKEEHNDHHSHVVDIEKMYHGDVPLLTVEQFNSKSKMKKKLYSVYRHPVVFLLVSPFYLFFLKSRYPAMYTRKVILSVLITNMFVAAIYIPLLIYFGFWVMVFVFAAPAYIGGMIGVGLFYLQHNYPDATWFTTEAWEHENASLEGSSLIVLPQPLEWFSNAIGYHHIHHLNSSVPGYRLRECYDAVEEFRTIQPLTWRGTIEAFRLKFWSYELNKMVTMKESAGLKS